MTAKTPWWVSLLFFGSRHTRQQREIAHRLFIPTSVLVGLVGSGSFYVQYGHAATGLRYTVGLAVMAVFFIFSLCMGVAFRIWSAAAMRWMDQNNKW